MGEVTGIAWCDHTFNAWIGCHKVSQACKHCYAEVDTFARTRRARGLELWGADAHRHVTSDDNWRKPLAWNRAAQAAGVRRKVFCSSLSDVFEARDDLDAVRERLWALIEATPHLDWLLLTKRPEEIRKRVPARWLTAPPPNVWLGTTVETQADAERRIPHLLRAPAVLKFVSVEPLLEQLDLDPPTCPQCGGHDVHWVDGTPCCNEHGDEMNFGAWLDPLNGGIGWVIVGGESGPGARPFDVAWIDVLRDQCRDAGVPLFVKQLGAVPFDSREAGRDSDEPHPGGAAADPDCRLNLAHPKGGDPEEWDEAIRVREFPTPLSTTPHQGETDHV